MGTNYYIQNQHEEQCYHIGKSSMGWCFGLHIWPEFDFHTLAHIREFWSQPSFSIIDEYGTAFTDAEMLKVITHRGNPEKKERGKVPMGYESWDDFHEKNYSVDGPNGLVRYALGDRCLRHGHGTWDEIVGEFS